MIGIVVVVYKNFAQTLKFITEEVVKLPQPYKLVVVNNASTEEDMHVLAEAYGAQSIEDSYVTVDCSVDKYVICVRENLGYAKGNNLGADFIIRNFKCDYLLFSNDDIIFTMPDVCNKLITCLDKDLSVGAIGPRVVGLDGGDQSPHTNVITPYRQIAWKLLHFLRRKTKGVARQSTKPSSGYCYWVSGAFFMMRTTDFISISGFDPNTFLYAEEVIIAERLKKIGKQMFFCAETEVLHLGGSTTDQTFSNKEMKKILVESNSLYYRRYLGCNKLIVWVYKFVNRF